MCERAGWPRRWWRAGVSGVAALVLIGAACSREREEGEREEEASESAAQEQHEKAQTQQPLAPIDWKQVDAGLGKSGALQPDGAYKVGMPRSDIHVTIGGVAVKPALARGSRRPCTPRSPSPQRRSARPPRQHPPEPSVSTPRRLRRSSATTERSTVACTRLACRGWRRSRLTGWTSFRLWAWQRRSTSSRRVVASRRSLAT